MSRDHPPSIVMSELTDGAVRVIFMPIDLTLAGAPNVMDSHGSDEHAHCAQQPPEMPLACQYVLCDPSMA